MKTVIFATGEILDAPALQERLPAPLWPLFDRPFLQHVIEHLIEQGFDQFDIVLSHRPEAFEDFLGDGTRWGRTFTYHLARDPSRPYRCLQQACPASDDTPFLLVHAEHLPTALHASFPPQETAATPMVYAWCDMTPEATEPTYHWTGWAWLTAAHARRLPGDIDTAELGRHFMQSARDAGTLQTIPRPLSVLSYDDVLHAYREILSQREKGISFSGREVQAGIWMSRNVILHPTAELKPPVYIGENCQIGKDVQLGPMAAINRNCVIDSLSTVTDTVVFPGSYVGEALELADVIVDQKCLINVRLGIEVPVADDFLLGNLSSKPLSQGVGGTLSRVVAGMLLMASSPVLLATAGWLKLTRSGPVMYRTPVVALPTPQAPEQWQTFERFSFEQPTSTQPASPRDLLLYALPGLINILRGEMAFVGLQPRTPEELQSLDRDWQTFHLQGKTGLVSEAAVQHDACPNDDELYMAEAYYVATRNWRHDGELMAKYLWRVCRSAFRREPAP